MNSLVENQSINAESDDDDDDDVSDERRSPRQSLDPISSVDEDTTSSEECPISQLPVEILRIMLTKYLTKGSDRKSARLVSKLWYENCVEEEVTISVRGGSAGCQLCQNYLERCRAKRLNLDCFSAAACDFPTELWREIGPRIQSLRFTGSIQGETFENAISCCENLLSLYVHVGVAQVFIVRERMQKLASLSVVRQKMETVVFMFTIPPSASGSWQELKSDMMTMLDLAKRTYPNASSHVSSRNHQIRSFYDERILNSYNRQQNNFWTNVKSKLRMTFESFI